jgi:tetratricopeptide (TPR) repeat protein
MDESSALVRRYGQTAASEWQRVLNHFALGEGFALIVLIVPDRDGAQLCRDELDRLLAAQGSLLTRCEPTTPDQLVWLSNSLLDLPPGPNTGAVWIAAVVPRSARDFHKWESAWRQTLEGLNQQRNPLRRYFECPVIIVAAPWIVPLFREVAPDLWSVRSQVVRIEPDREITRRRSDETEHASTRSEPSPRLDAPDPGLAMNEAERLRGMPGRERDLSAMLTRAGIGLLGRGDPSGAESVLREAADLVASAGGPVSRGITIHELGRAIRDQGRAAEAEETFRRALALAEEGGDTAVSRGITMHELGRAIRDQGRAAEAEKTFRRALALKEEGGDTAVSRGITVDNLGRAIRDQGRAAEAEESFRRALALAEEGGATAVSRGITMHNLGRAILDQGRAAEAEETFRRALALAKEGGSSEDLLSLIQGDLQKVKAL